uniref:Uncharacterized protein n=1 Tax=Siphoviridae sp. ctoMB99 TaxID=2826459 RepID=A0A8S5MZJ9_9CAUD|nr:MAG TPA: hypothetical protein [Siphoviridae sp. ctoMB99]
MTTSCGLAFWLDANPPKMAVRADLTAVFVY